MMLDLFRLIAVFAPLMGAMDQGWKHGRAYGALIGLIVGLAVGKIGFVGIGSLDRWIDRHPKIGGPTVGLWLVVSYLLFLGIIIWIVGLAILAAYLTTSLLRL